MSDKRMWGALRALCLLGAAGCAAAGPAAEPAPAFPVGQARVQSVTVEQEYVAELVAVRYAELRARVDGVIDAVHVDEGQSVRAGEPIFSVNTRALSQQLAVAEALARRAEAELSAAQAERDNTRALQAQGVVSAAALTLAEATVEAALASREEARANAGLARLQRDLATVRAPFDGVVNRLPLKVGSSVSAQDLFTTISDPSELFAYFSLSEREGLAWLARGGVDPAQPVGLVMADGALYPEAGAIDAVSSELDPDTRSLVLRARFANPAGLLRHGGSAKVRLGTALQSALLVPQRATRDLQGSTFVYVLDGEGVPQPRRIDATQRWGEDFIVASGLQPGESFVLEGLQKLRAGEPITVRDAAAGG